jgi:DsbC/DsbD-like thiol-disulfide interchange protein
LRIDRRTFDLALRAAIVPAALAACPLLSLLAARPAAAAASPWISNPQSQVRLISGDSVAPRHGELRLGVQFRLAPKWHVYWKNSGDAGFAPVVTWKAVPGLTPPELLWPAPRRFELPGGLEAFGYAGEVVYPVRAAIDAAPGSGQLRLAANVDYLVCEVDCVPYRYDLSLDQPLGEQAQADPRTTELIAGWRTQVPLALTADRQPVPASTLAAPANAHLAATPGAREVTAQTEVVRTGPSEARVELRLRDVAAAPGGADLFFESHPALELGRPRVVAAPGELRFEAPVRRKDTSVPFPAATEIAWTATGLEQPGLRTPLALAARQRVMIAGAPAPAPPAVAAAGAAGARQGVRGSLAAADPRALALGAVGAALLTLEAWGLLRARRPAKSREAPAPSAEAPPAAQREPPPSDRETLVATRREAAGFGALLLTLALLYALSLEISAEALAGVELILLVMALVAWLRHRIERPALVRMLLSAALAACVAVPPWLAGRNRLAGGLAATHEIRHQDTDRRSLDA